MRTHAQRNAARTQLNNMCLANSSHTLAHAHANFACGTCTSAAVHTSGKNRQDKKHRIQQTKPPVCVQCVNAHIPNRIQHKCCACAAALDLPCVHGFSNGAYQPCHLAGPHTHMLPVLSSGRSSELRWRTCWAQPWSGSAWPRSRCQGR